MPFNPEIRKLQIANLFHGFRFLKSAAETVNPQLFYDSGFLCHTQFFIFQTCILFLYNKSLILSITDA